jgi:hypothetical protein
MTNQSNLVFLDLRRQKILSQEDYLAEVNLLKLLFKLKIATEKQVIDIVMHIKESFV